MANDSAGTSYFSMKARACRAIAARSGADGGRTPAGVGASWARAGRNTAAGRTEAPAAILMKSRRAISMAPSPCPLIGGASPGDVEYRAGREGAVFRGEPRHHGRQLFHQHEAVL